MSAVFDKRFHFKFKNQKINWYAEPDNAWKTIEFTLENLKTVRSSKSNQATKGLGDCSKFVCPKG